MSVKDTIDKIRRIAEKLENCQSNFAEVKEEADEVIRLFGDALLEGEGLSSMVEATQLIIEDAETGRQHVQDLIGACDNAVIHLSRTGMP